MHPYVHARKRTPRDVYCARGAGGIVPEEPGSYGWLGNPVRIGRPCPVCEVVHHAAGSTLACYERYLWRRLRTDPSWRNAAIEVLMPALRGEGTRLSCFCDDPGHCHTSRLAQLVPVAAALDAYFDLPTCRAYAGIGARATPLDVQALMTDAAVALARRGWTLYSGGARGADEAFLQGALAVNDPLAAPPLYRVFLPGARFQRHQHDGLRFLDATGLDRSVEGAVRVTRATWDLHARRHDLPAFSGLAPFTRHLMTRNALQVLGTGLEARVRFVLCWTPDGCTSWHDRMADTGGTGQAVALASLLGVPVFNLASETDRARIASLVDVTDA